MPRHGGSRVGGHFKGRSGGNTRRVRKKGKSTYAKKQDILAPYWVAVGAYSTVAMGRPSNPKNPPKPQKPKEQGRGGRGGKGGGGK